MDEGASQQTTVDERGGPHVRYGTWGWGGRHGFPWLGGLLIAVGIGLVVAQADPRIDEGHGVAFFAGLVFWAAFLFWWAGGWAGLPAALLTGWGLAGALRDLGYVSGGGWTALLIGAGFLAMYLTGLARRGRHAWALWVGLIFVGIGALQVAAREIPGLPPLDALVVPVLLIGVGVLLVLRAIGWRR